MSKNAKHYDYYKVEGQAVKALIDGYNAIEEQRKEIINGILGEFGAAGFIDSAGWGDKGGLIQSLAWPSDHQFPCQMTVKRRDFLGDQHVIIARGKANTADGREFNKKLDASLRAANEKLKSLPVWQAYIIDHYGVLRTGFGSAADRGWGISMLTTYGGRCPGRDDCLLFAIPNSKAKEPGEVRHGSVEIPPEFQQLTYGQFYDLTTVTDKEDDE